MMYIILAFICIILVLIVSIVILAFILKLQKNKLKKIEHTNKLLQVSLNEIKDFHKGLSYIKEKHEPIITKVKEAKTNEEVYSAISDILSANRRRV